MPVTVGQVVSDIQVANEKPNAWCNNKSERLTRGAKTASRAYQPMDSDHNRGCVDRNTGTDLVPGWRQPAGQ